MRTPARRARFRARFHLALLFGLLLAASCAKSDYAHLYQTSPFAPSYSAADIANLNHMGANIVDKGVNFAVYSQHATKLQLALFDDPESNQPSRQFDMIRQGDVWSVYVEGLGVGQAYGFIAWGPNWDFDPNWYCGSIIGFKADVDLDGNRFNPNKLLTDPYAKEIHRDHDWSKGSTATGPDRAKCDYAAASKSLVIQSTYAWSDSETSWREMRKDGTAIGHRWQDLIIYEVHPKGFTADSASGVQHPGTYRGIGEKAAYFKELGITAVELMPVFEKPLDGGYWGYQTIGFFMPEREYANDKVRWGPVEEFKWMVDQLHQQGIEVILDVVYNHTGEGGLWRQYIQDSFTPDPSLNPANYHDYDPKEVAGLYSFRGLDNQAYYALDPTNQFYWNNTGVGQETRPNNVPMRRLILDSLEYWVTEFHVDGFRFDLAPILDETDHNYNQQMFVGNSMDPASVVQAIIDDPVLQQYNTRIVAEPWSLVAYDIAKFPAATSKDGTAWGEWNGPFRDWWRSFSVADENMKFNNCDDNNRDDPNPSCPHTGGFFLFGSQDFYQWNNRRPYHSTNFVTIHDGFTMYDLMSYDQKVNGCGPLNPACCPQTPGICDEQSGEDNNRSRNFGGIHLATGANQAAYYDGLQACIGNGDGSGCTIGHDVAEQIKRQHMRNLFAAMLLAHGTPMLLGGDEWMRTQLGNNNAYTSGADNPSNWFQWGFWTVDTAHERMHDFVRQLIQLRKDHAYALAPDSYTGGAPMKWMNEGGTEGPNWHTRHLAQWYWDGTQGKQLYILYNFELNDQDFVFPPGGASGWNLLLDTQAPYDDDTFLQGQGADPAKTYNAFVNPPYPFNPVSGHYTAKPNSVVVFEAAN